MTSVRPAATLLVVRDGSDGIEVAMGRRPPGGPFGDVWVFPGGAVDAEDRAAASDAENAWRLAALRETWEEVGLALTDPEGTAIPVGPGSVHDRLMQMGAGFAVDRLVYLSNWVTPAFVSKRFDTRFYVVEADGPLASGEELVEVRWIPAAKAVELHDRDRFPMIFPTFSHLRYVRDFNRVSDLLTEARKLDVIPAIEPRPSERGTRTDLVVDNDPRFAP
ncbi:MAG: NUDIX hydrolase [Acidimicrobiia bacterium]|nr:NUDIX hydrolase [Acidimicrobiia bacterium]